MKITKLTILATILAVLVMIGISDGSDAESSEDFTYVSEGDCVIITGYLGADPEIEIPSEIDGKPVTAIGTNAFQKNKNIVSVTIPSTVTMIMDGAFDRSSVSTVVFEGDGLVEIGKQAFFNCTSLTSISLPDSLDKIGPRAFKGCSSLTTVGMPETIGKIASEAFAFCTSLISITIPSGANVSAENVFNECTSLLEIIIDEDVYFIDVITFPCHTFYAEDGVTVLDKTGLKGNTFHGKTVDRMIVDHDCTALFMVDDEVFSVYVGKVGTPIVVPTEEPARTGYTFIEWKGYIEGMVFTENVSFEAVFTINQYTATFVADGVVVSSEKYDYGSYIVAPEAPAKEGYVFLGWSGYTEETVVVRNMTFYAEYSATHHTVAFIADGKPVSVSNMEYGEVIVAPEAPAKEGYTFVEWNGYTEGMTVPNYNVAFNAVYAHLELDVITVVLDQTTCYTVEYGDVPDIPIPSVEGYVFKGWYLDKDYTQPYDIDTPVVDNLVIYASMGRAEYSGICGENLVWSLDENGVLTVSGKGDMYVWFTMNSVPWFGNRSEIRSVVLGEGVASIGKYSFYECYSLVSITLPSTLVSIQDSSFVRCYSLVEVLNDSALEMKTGGSDNGHVAKYAVNVYSTGYGASILRGYTEGGVEYTFMTLDGKEYLVKSTGTTGDIVLPAFLMVDGKTVTGYGVYSYAYYGCTGLTSVSMGSVNSIGDSAFQECTSLVSVEMPVVKTVGSSAFYNCSSLTSPMTGSLESIGGAAFFQCTSLTCMDLSTVTYIGNLAFSRCSALTVVHLDSVITVGDKAFQYSTSLTEISIGDSDTESLPLYQAISLGAGETVRYYIVPSATGILTIGSDGYSDTFGKLYLGKECIAYDDDGGNKDNFLLEVEVTKGVGYVLEIGCYINRGPAMIFGSDDGIFVSDTSSVITVGSNAFNGCSSIEEMYLSPTVGSVGTNAFNGLTFYCDDIQIQPTAEFLSGKTFVGNNGKLYEKDPVVYTVTFKFGKYDLTYTSVYGKPVEVPPYKPVMDPTDGYEYSFVSWKGYTEGMTVTSDLVFYPEFYYTVQYTVTLTDTYGNVTILNVPFGGHLEGEYSQYRYYCDSEMTVEWNPASCIFNDLSLYVVYGIGGMAGDDVSWFYCFDGTLYLDGTGATYNWSAKTAPWYKYRSEITTVYVGDDVTYLGSYSFYKYPFLNTLFIGDSVEKIGKYAVVSYNMEYLCIGSSLEYIGVRGLYGMTFYDGDKAINPTAENLRSKIFVGTDGTLGLMYIYGAHDSGQWYIDVESDTLYISGTGSTGNWSAMTAPWYQYRGHIVHVVVENGITELGDFAFYCYPYVKTIVLGDTVERIGQNSLRGCGSLEKISFGEGLTSIGSNALTGYSFVTPEGKSLKASAKNLAGHTFVSDGSKTFVRVA